MAEKRKALIDEMAIQAQTDADHFQAELTEMRKKHEEALETSEERMRETRKRGVEVDKLLNKLSGKLEVVQKGGGGALPNVKLPNYQVI